MGEDTKIEWAQHTFNPWIGCTKVSPGCDNCYAERTSKRLNVVWGPDNERKPTSEANWKKPLGWNKRAKNKPVVLCGSLCDVFEDRPELHLYRNALWELIDRTPNLRWALLTKRPENIVDMVPMTWLSDWPEQAMVGASVENQEMADKRIPELLQVPAKLRFISCEPLLGPVNLDSIQTAVGAAVAIYLQGGMPRINWVIAGGETGKKARPVHPAWLESLYHQCQHAGIPFFFKHWGEWHPLGKPPYKDDECVVYTCGYWSDNTYKSCKEHYQMHSAERCVHSGHVMRRVGQRTAGRDLGEHFDDALCSGRPE